MSAAMVSRYLPLAVEDWFDRLLHRTTRKVSLTDAGLAALPPALLPATAGDRTEAETEGRHLAAGGLQPGEPAGGDCAIDHAGSCRCPGRRRPVLGASHEQVEIVLSVGDKPPTW